MNGGISERMRFGKRPSRPPWSQAMSESGTSFASMEIDVIAIYLDSSRPSTSKEGGCRRKIGAGLPGQRTVLDAPYSGSGV
jgi:hypothetical protein